MTVSTLYMSLSVGVGACQLHPALWVDGVSHRCGTKILMESNNYREYGFSRPT